MLRPICRSGTCVKSLPPLLRQRRSRSSGRLYSGIHGPVWRELTSGAVARAPRQPLHVTMWLAPRHPPTSRPFPVGEVLADPPFKRGVVLPITATPSASSVTASSLFPRSLLSTIRLSQSFRTASSGSVRFCSLFPYGHFFAALAPIYHSRPRPL